MDSNVSAKSLKDNMTEVTMKNKDEIISSLMSMNAMLLDKMNTDRENRKERQKQYLKKYRSTPRGKEQHRLRVSRDYYKRQIEKTLLELKWTTSKSKKFHKKKNDYIKRCQDRVEMKTRELNAMGLN